MVATDGKSEGSYNHHLIKSEMTGVVTDSKSEGSYNNKRYKDLDE